MKLEIEYRDGKVDTIISNDIVALFETQADYVKQAKKNKNIVRVEIIL